MHGPDLATDLNSYVENGELLSLFCTSIYRLQNLRYLLSFLKWEYTEAVEDIGGRHPASACV